jgi:hypothetical protein
MAQKTLRVLVCDVCGAQDEDIRSYRFSLGTTGAPRKVDLCTQHAQPLLDLGDKLEEGAPKRGRSQKRKVVSREEARRR